MRVRMIPQPFRAHDICTANPVRCGMCAVCWTAMLDLADLPHRDSNWQKEHIMQRMIVGASLILALVGLAAANSSPSPIAAQQTTPAAQGPHPFDSTWMADSLVASENDSPT